MRLGLAAVTAVAVAGLVLPATSPGLSEALGLSKALGISRELGFAAASEAAVTTPGTPARGSHAFMQHQPGRVGTPVTYDPCQALWIRIDTDGVDVGVEPLARELILSAMHEVSAATGLRLRYDDSSTDRSRRRTASQPGAEPGLVTFATSSEVPELEGRVAGVGGSTSVSRDGIRTYVSGRVTLDAEAFDRWLSEPAFVDSARAIVLHELGHLVGLGHVQDQGELMNVLTTGQLDFGPGDRRGLAELGQGHCF